MEFSISFSTTQPLYAFPDSEANFTNWNSLRVEATSSLNRHTFDVDESISKVWYVFEGSTAPASWSEWVAIKDFTLELSQYFTGII
jgi:hypothetical protein